eukprot:5208222-Pleurochrysis_carterae.AAC.2
MGRRSERSSGSGSCRRGGMAARERVRLCARSAFERATLVRTIAHACGDRFSSGAETQSDSHHSSRCFGRLRLRRCVRALRRWTGTRRQLRSTPGACGLP